MNGSQRRVFKTAWFSRASKKAHITNEELCDAIEEVLFGQADKLGGGVLKKRLNKNMHRSIIVAKDGRYWVMSIFLQKRTGRTSAKTN